MQKTETPERKAYSFRALAHTLVPLITGVLCSGIRVVSQNKNPGFLEREEVQKTMVDQRHYWRIGNILECSFECIEQFF